MKVYGIKNCNTVKSALDWLKKNNVEFEFHDYKTKGVTTEELQRWDKQVGWESLVNKRGTTWRQLDPKLQNAITSSKAAIALMKDKTSVIKRPLIEVDGRIITLGFDEDVYKKAFSN
jgi:arsenate reductase (glutaredoxin)